jgi:hypothetical protein
MPRYWDLACAVARTPLLGEEQALSNTLMRKFLGDTPSDQDTEAFNLALSARMIASIAFNMWLASEGHANAELAWKRLQNGLCTLDSILAETP